MLENSEWNKDYLQVGCHCVVGNRALDQGVKEPEIIQQVTSPLWTPASTKAKLRSEMIS